MTKAQKPAETAAPHIMDMGELNEHIMKIATRSQKLLGSFMARGEMLKNKANAADHMHLIRAFADFTKQTMQDPHQLVDAHINFWKDYVTLLQNTLAMASGEEVTPVIDAQKGDNRWRDDDWAAQWYFSFIKQSYLLFSRWVHAQIDHIEGIDHLDAHKVRFYGSQVVDAMSPSNFWMTNPAVLRETVESKGENLLKGLENLLADMEKGAGQLQITMSKHSAFKFGENIAASKGKVVFQNELFQLIQYSPLTEKVKKTPMLIVPPWINKFYILDLKPEGSFVRYLVEQGHTVFLVSWANPTEKHAHLSFEDYMSLGTITAMREVKNITGENSTNMIGYCIGGTLTASTLAWLAAQDTRPADIPEVNSVTYLTTMVDFSDVGDLAVFIDEEQISALEAQMNVNGYLPGTALAASFSMLRANDLIWSFVVNNYLLGKEPFPFDMLTWNSDSTNLPAKMHSYYLRNMYLNNKLIEPNALVMNDTPIDLRKIEVPSFLLSTIDDHIAPWKTTYTATQLYSGPVTFCLSGSGHIAGAMNPPAKKKYGYWTNDLNKHPSNPDDWFKDAKKNEGSWWPAWIKWLNDKSGEDVPARDPEKNDNVIEDAPGSYVKGSLFG